MVAGGSRGQLQKEVVQFTDTNGKSFLANPLINRDRGAIPKVMKKGFRGTELPRIEGKDRQAKGHGYPFF
jgi:hypothetical protein